MSEDIKVLKFHILSEKKEVWCLDKLVIPRVEGESINLPFSFLSRRGLVMNVEDRGLVVNVEDNILRSVYCF